MTQRQGRGASPDAWRLTAKNADEVFVPALIVAFAIVAIGASFGFPIFEAPDEWSHYQYARVLAETGRLPLQTDPERRSHAEGFNPPLYYVVPALILIFDGDRGADIDVPRYGDDWDETIELMYGESQDRTLTPPRNRRFVWWERGRELNYFEHPPGGPLTDRALLPMHLMRMFSVLCGVVTLLGVWRIGREVLSDDAAARFFAVAIVAFNPQFVFLSGALNSDNGVVALATLAIWRMTVLLRRGKTGPWTVSILGILLAAGAMAKTNMLFLVAPALAVLWFRRRTVGDFARDAAILGAWLVGLCGWFFVRNAWVYGGWDFLGWKTRALLQPDFVLPTERRATFFRREFLPTVYDSFWGWFGWLTVRMRDGQYLLFRLLGLSAAVGVLAAIFDRARRSLRPMIVLLVSCIGLNLISLFLFNFRFLAHQGRLIFPSIGAIAVLFGVAFAVATRPVGRFERWVVAGTLAVGLLLNVLYTWSAILRPIYF